MSFDAEGVKEEKTNVLRGQRSRVETLDNPNCLGMNGGEERKLDITLQNLRDCAGFSSLCEIVM